jgi:putative transposase
MEGVSKEREGCSSDMIGARRVIRRALLPQADLEGRPLSITGRWIINAIFTCYVVYICSAIYPRIFSNSKTCIRIFAAGYAEYIHIPSRLLTRGEIIYQTEPSAEIVKNQTVKISALCGDERGYEGGKKILWLRHHLLVEAQGFLLALYIYVSNLLDSDGAKRLLFPLVTHFLRPS